MEWVFIDEETGESLVYPSCKSASSEIISTVNDAETGEPEVSVMEPSMRRNRKVPFQIPKEMQKNMSKKSKKSIFKRFGDAMEMEPVPVGASFGQINPICLFLPAIIYFRWFLALLMFFEVALHVWAHHKNKQLKNSSVYFRSPFHAISAEFCALCQSETCMDRVGKLQQIRMHKFLRQCNYMNPIVT